MPIVAHIYTLYGKNNYVQIITYIRHSPFLAPLDFPALVPGVYCDPVILPLVVDANAVFDFDLGVFVADFS